MKIPLAIRNLLALWTGLGCATETAACTCYEKSPVKEAYAGAALVVVGKVVSLSYVGLAETMHETKRAQLEKKVPSGKQHLLTGTWITKVQIEIEQSFKGSPVGGKSWCTPAGEVLPAGIRNSKWERHLWSTASRRVTFTGS